MTLSQSAALARSFEPIQLAGLKLRNRYVKTATFENQSPGGRIRPGLAQFHRDVAAGGTGLTTVAYCGVSADARTFDDEFVVSEETLPALRALAEGVHGEGGAVSGQLAHCGGFSRSKPTLQRRPLGPNNGLNAYGLFSGVPFTGAMTKADMARTAADYVRSAQLLLQAGFDAFEIHMGHGYLLSQFISPAVNRRTDEYGGSLANRMRFPLQVLEAVRKAVGDQVPLLAKMNLSDGLAKGGTTVQESAQVARMLERAGINAIVMSGGLVDRTSMHLFRGASPLQHMIALEKNPAMRLAMKLGGKKGFPSLPFEPLYFREEALRVREAVGVRLAYLGGVCSGEDVAKLMDDGFDLVCVGRALLYEPAMVNRLREDASYRSPCDHCNLCVSTIAHPQGTHCPRRGALG